MTAHVHAMHAAPGLCLRLASSFKLLCNIRPSTKRNGGIMLIILLIPVLVLFEAAQMAQYLSHPWFQDLIWDPGGANREPYTKQLRQIDDISLTSYACFLACATRHRARPVHFKTANNLANRQLWLLSHACTAHPRWMNADSKLSISSRFSK